MSRYDLVVLGGGTAGLVAAFGAAGVGARVLLAEPGRTGGDCLWTGCVPSKTLIAAAARAHAMRTADLVGLASVDPQVDLGRVMDRVRAAIATIEPDDSPDRLRQEGVEVLHDPARFVAPGRLDVGGRAVAYRTALIATGSTPAMPPIEGLAAADPLTSDTVWELRDLPERLVVLGGGPIGCELGQAMARLGSRVTIVEMADRLLAGADPEAGSTIAQALRDEGVDVRVAATATRVTGNLIEVAGGGGGTDTVGFDRVLVATGRTPTTSELGLARVGVATDRAGFVIVDDVMATSGRNIFAAGDVTGRMPFTHVAAAQAGLVVTNALFRLRRRLDESKIPWTIFTDPEVAHVGIDIATARARWGDEAIVTRVPLTDVNRAVTAAATRGFATLVADPRGRLAGATVVAPSAGESIAEMVAWLHADGTLRQIGDAVHAYPTWSEGPWKAAREHLRQQFLSPRVRLLTRPLVAALRHLDVPR